MKRLLFAVGAMVMIEALLLTACASPATPPAASGGGAPSGNSGSNGASSGGFAAGNGGGGFGNAPLSQAAQLVIGTFKLQGTSNAVTAQEAAKLVPLWQSYDQLTSSNTSTADQINASVSEIQSAMTPQQVQAITAMNLTRQDEMSTMSSLGVGGFRGGNGTPGFGGFNGTPGFRGTPGAGGYSGGTSGSGPRPTPNATQMAARASFASRVPSPLVNALISLLQKVASGSS